MAKPRMVLTQRRSIPTEAGVTAGGYPPGSLVPMPRLAAIFLALAAALGGAAQAPSRPWEIDPARGLVWQGQPYTPVGLRIAGTREAVDAAKALRVQDVLVEASLAAGWSEALAALEAGGFRYILSLADRAPHAPGFIVAPESYRVPGIAAAITLDVPLRNAPSALVVLASQRDGNVAWAKTFATEDGRLRAEIDPETTLEHVALIYPQSSSTDLPDAWERLDAHRDLLMSRLQSSPPGNGLRGFVNPLGDVAGFAGAATSVVPTSPAFRQELESQIRRRYTTVATATRAWSISASDIETIEHLARLVPLWTGTRGVSRLWDPESKVLYTCDNRRSTIWSDVREVVQQSTARRFARLVGSLKQIRDVPVVQDWRGWPGPYERSGLGLDGVGGRLDGSTGSSLIRTAAPVAACSLRAGGPPWLIATELDVSADGLAQLGASIEDSASMGFRAWYVQGSLEQVVPALGAIQPRYAGRTDTLFYPASAANPAAPMRLAGGLWWLPRPVQGERIDLGPRLAGYRCTDGGETFTAIWSRDGARRVKLRLADPKSVSVKSPSGYDPKAKVAKKTLELTLTEVPLVISGPEIPIPEESMLEAGQEIQKMILKGSSMVASMGEEEFLFRDLLGAFERSPGASYLEIVKLRHRLRVLTGDVAWIEAEVPSRTNFSEVAGEPGVSGQQTLDLRTPLPPPTGGYVADYRFTARIEGEHEVWLAGKVPLDQVAAVSIVVGDQTFRASGTPVSLYADGFGWYRLGRVSLAKGPLELTLRADTPAGADLRIDAIVLAPGAFRPQGAILR